MANSPRNASLDLDLSPEQQADLTAVLVSAPDALARGAATLEAMESAGLFRPVAQAPVFVEVASADPAKAVREVFDELHGSPIGRNRRLRRVLGAAIPTDCIAVQWVDPFGFRVIHVHDRSGRLHRYDGPAVLVEHPGGEYRAQGDPRLFWHEGTRAWWEGRWYVEGICIDDARLLPEITCEGLVEVGDVSGWRLDQDEADALADYLPSGFEVRYRSQVLAPARFAHLLATDDLDSAVARFFESGLQLLRE